MLTGRCQNVCPVCGGTLGDYLDLGGDIFCDTCGFKIREDGTYDYSEVEDTEGSEG